MRDLIVTREAAKMIGRTESALKVWRINGFGPPFFKLGKGVMYDHAELVKWLEVATPGAEASDAAAGEKSSTQIQGRRAGHSIETTKPCRCDPTGLRIVVASKSNSQTCR